MQKDFVLLVFAPLVLLVVFLFVFALLVFVVSLLVFALLVLLVVFLLVFALLVFVVSLLVFSLLVCVCGVSVGICSPGVVGGVSVGICSSGVCGVRHWCEYPLPGSLTPLVAPWCHSDTTPLFARFYPLFVPDVNF